LLDWRTRTNERILLASISIILVVLLSLFLLQHIRRLHQSQALFRSNEAKFISLFQHSPVPLALVSVNRKSYAEVNDALVAQSGYQREEMIGKTSQELQTWADISDRQPFIDLLLRQEYVDRYEVRFRHRDGRIIICLLSSRLINSEGEQMILFSPIDISKQREIENEIRQLNLELEQRVKQRTINLEEANLELSKTLATLQNMQGEILRSEKMAALGSMVAGVAHELNTPIGNSVTVATTLQDNADFMLEEIRTGHPRRTLLDQTLDASANGAEILVRNLNRAAALVSSFKQLAVDQSSNHRRHFDLRQAVEEVILTLTPMYKKTPYRFELDLAPDIELESYPGPLGQVITNFITNALSHAFEGRAQGTMFIVTRKRINDEVEITFSDNGIGISAEQLKRVFDPFYTTKLGQGGSGLGMHIVYDLVTGILGGKISLDSTPGQGLTIQMILPMVAPVPPMSRADYTQ
jgi:PAS domain S-box-containing protein